MGETTGFCSYDFVSAVSMLSGGVARTAVGICCGVGTGDVGLDEVSKGGKSCGVVTAGLGLDTIGGSSCGVGTAGLGPELFGGEGTDVAIMGGVGVEEEALCVGSTTCGVGIAGVDGS